MKTAGLIIVSATLAIHALFGLVQDKKKPGFPTKATVVFTLDSNSTWVNPKQAIAYLEDRRIKLREQYLLEDARIASQIELLHNIAQDSLRLKK